jgi:hypothetical protein
MVGTGRIQGKIEECMITLDGKPDRKRPLRRI